MNLFFLQAAKQGFTMTVPKERSNQTVPTKRSNQMALRDRCPQEDPKWSLRRKKFPTKRPSHTGVSKEDHKWPPKDKKLK